VIIAYLMAFILTVQVKTRVRYNFFPFPEMKVTKTGLIFVSKLRHRLKINDAKVMHVDKNVFVQREDTKLSLINVDKVMTKNGYIYFTCLGKCKISIDLDKIYKYFAIELFSDKLDLQTLKKEARIDILNNIFNLTRAEKLKLYLKTIRNTLGIRVNKDNLKIRQNKFKIPFILTYKLRGKTKKVSVNNCKK